MGLGYYLGCPGQSHPPVLSLPFLCLKMPLALGSLALSQSSALAALGWHKLTTEILGSGMWRPVRILALASSTLE